MSSFYFAVWLWTPLQDEIVSGWQSTNKHMSLCTVMTQMLRLKTTSKLSCVPLPKFQSSFWFPSVWDFARQWNAWCLASSICWNEIYSQGDWQLANQISKVHVTDVCEAALCIQDIGISHQWKGKLWSMQWFWKGRLLEFSSAVRPLNRLEDNITALSEDSSCPLAAFRSCL